MVGKALLVVQNFYINVFLLNDTFAWLIFKKNIPRINLNLVLATKNLKKSRFVNFILKLKVNIHNPKNF